MSGPIKAPGKRGNKKPCPGRPMRTGGFCREVRTQQGGKVPSSRKGRRRGQQVNPGARFREWVPNSGGEGGIGEGTKCEPEKGTGCPPSAYSLVREPWVVSNRKVPSRATEKPGKKKIGEKGRGGSSGGGDRGKRGVRERPPPAAPLVGEDTYLFDSLKRY